MTTPPQFDTLFAGNGIFPASLEDELRKSFKTVIIRPKNDPTPEELAQIDVIWSYQLPASLKSASQAPNLKLFQGISAGYNHLPAFELVQELLPSGEQSPIAFASASGIHVSTIGEHAIGTVLALYHKLHQLIIAAHVEKRWINSVVELGFFAKELRGKNFGVVGYGHIGRETARLAHAFGANILALTRSGKKSSIGGYLIPGTGDEEGDLPKAWYSTESASSTLEFFSQCDVVLVTLPSSAGTLKFVGEEQLKAMKGDAILVNIGRGDTLDQDKLLEALQAIPAEGEAIDAIGSLRIGGASLDVSTPEPLPNDHPLFSVPNAIITPHSSGLSSNYFHFAADVLLQNIARLKEGKGALNSWLGRREDAPQLVFDKPGRI